MSWGRLAAEPHDVVALFDRARAGQALHADRPGLPYGNGRSYGDVCLNPHGVLWRTRGLDRFIAFDAATGRVEAESGLTIGELVALALPHGWFVPVTPGTQHVTLGGAIANDVHGKNHHVAGTFGEHVLALALRRTDGTRLVCGPDRESGWFRATVGGLGLTGLIESVELQLRRVPGAWIRQWTTPFRGLDAFFVHGADASARHAYTVAWVDASSGAGGAPRGLLFAGDHADGPALAERSPRRVRLVPPRPLVNATTARVFDALYHRRQKARPSPALVHWRPFFYPLDGVQDWNRLYGPHGFFQYQCVVPRANERDAMDALLRRLARARAGAFLAVLKAFEDRPPAGLLSFPMAGTTLAVDLPNAGDRTRALLDDLDAIVAAAQGRLYPAKDARMPAALFRAGYPQWPELEPYRDPGISSAMSRRLVGH
jgi:FAD/FMN-containing dehydrogenase